MKMSEIFVAELDRETERSRRALEKFPHGKFDWKPHDSSMALGYIATMVATIPSWVAMTATIEQFDIKPVGGPSFNPGRLDTIDGLLTALDKSAAEARTALQNATDEHLQTTWRLLESGKTVMETPRSVAIADTLNHWVHHRGQMTVYLRLMGVPVPALYGPSADDHRFL
jgi:uncharacterized damage-inducible protein DinB